MSISLRKMFRITAPAVTLIPAITASSRFTQSGQTSGIVRCQPLTDSDVVLTASFLPEGRRINDELLDLSRPLRISTIWTRLSRSGVFAMANSSTWTPARFRNLDLVLSFTGGKVLAALEAEYHARMVRNSVWLCRPRRLSSRRAGPQVPKRPELHGDIFSRPPGQARYLAAGALAPPSRENVFARGFAVSVELGMAGKRPPHGTRGTHGPFTVLFLFTN